MEGISYQAYNIVSVGLPSVFLAFTIFGIVLHFICCDKSIRHTLSIIGRELHGFWLKLLDNSQNKKYINNNLKAIIAKIRVLQERSPFKRNNRKSVLKDMLTKMGTIESAVQSIEADGKWTVQKEVQARRFEDKSKQLRDFLRDEIPELCQNIERKYRDQEKADNLLNKMENMVDKINKRKDYLIKLIDDKYDCFDTFFVIYPIIGFFCAVLDATFIFFSNAILTQSTGSCDVRMDCFAVSSSSNAAISILNYDNCSDYLRSSSYTVRCYTLSFNYAVALGKASSAFSFLGFLGFEFTLLGICIFIARSHIQLLRITVIYYIMINIATGLFTLLFVGGMICNFIKIVKVNPIHIKR